MRRYSFTTHLLCLLLLPFALFGGPVSFLCLGTDGHLALETAWVGSCETIQVCEEEHAHEVHGGCDSEIAANRESCCAGVGGGECGDCVDFLLQLEESEGCSIGFRGELPSRIQGLAGGFEWSVSAPSPGPVRNWGVPLDRTSPRIEMLAFVSLLI